MEDYALYKALQSYSPPNNDPNVLEFQKEDVFEITVQSPFAKTDTERVGWLYAYNRRTGEEGYVPVELVKLLGSEVNNTIHHPSASGVDIEASNTSYSLLPEPPPKVTKYHQFVDVFFVTPVFCPHCDDYIWGPGNIGVECKGKTDLQF